MDGFFIVNKPQGLTSHDVVDCVRRKFGIRRVGHAGTLDPMATGVLIVLIGKVTKQFNRFSSYDKEYEVTLTLGTSTDTGDAQGKILKSQSYENISDDDIKSAFAKFVGEIDQIPPMVSALKFKGKRLYDLARRGINVKRSPRKVKIYFLRPSEFNLPDVEFSVRCSKGTYIRKLGEDIGELLGCGGHISKIRRLSIGPFSIKDAVSLEGLNESHLRDWKG